jgi:hypothetical protein
MRTSRTSGAHFSSAMEYITQELDAPTTYRKQRCTARKGKLKRFLVACDEEQESTNVGKSTLNQKPHQRILKQCR